MISIKKLTLGLLVLLLAYLDFWPVAIEPLAWQPPQDRGFVGGFSPNALLGRVERLETGEGLGPEDFALDADGRLYSGTNNGMIWRWSADGAVELWHNTGGRPLGMEFDHQNNLIVADAYLGLLSISPRRQQQVLSDSYQGQPLGFVDDLDIGPDGRIYFSDASSKFAAKDSDSVMQASLLDIMEHGGHGRILFYDPADQSTKLLTGGLNFANGVAVSFDQQWLLVNETSHYRVIKIGIGADNFARQKVLIDNLPGFPDNISKGQDGRYWIGLAAPRNEQLDSMAAYPWLRKLVQRLPTFLRTKIRHYGHVIAIDEQGTLLHSLQDPTGQYAGTTGALEVGAYLYLSSIDETAIARVKKTAVGL